VNPEIAVDDYLLLSGIQHFAFCPRQWALIHIEQLWEESDRTIEGKILHENVDDPFFREKRKDIYIVRSLPVVSNMLALYGIVDVVEFTRVSGTEADLGIKLPRKRGRWTLKPIEYKRGHPKTESIDEVQLCAQAMALEEMLKISVDSGSIYYGQIKRRVEVVLNEGLRQEVIRLSSEMHRVFKERITPPAKLHNGCRMCSLMEKCQPKLTDKPVSVSKYINAMIEEVSKL
jgi:CRISPR-associated exonuclease Cas4